jgi:hypothetical protein
MVATYKIILPYELGYVGNKEADKRRKETKERLRQRDTRRSKCQMTYRNPIGALMPPMAPML